MIFEDLLRNNFFRNIRNNLKIKPTIILKPNKITSPISDFFYWENNQTFKTKFFIFNLATQAMPDENIEDEVKIFVFNYKGDQIYKKNILLEHNEIYELVFDNINLVGRGSFTVFHKFSKYDTLIQKKTNIADRGYTGYSKDNGIWNYVHGNNYSFSLEDNDFVKPLIPKTLFYNNYIPQVTFNDTSNFSILLSNPSYKKETLFVYLYDEKNNEISKKILYLNKFSTLKSEFNNVKATYIKIKSKLIFCRPIIIKNYDTYFDIFHG